MQHVINCSVAFGSYLQIVAFIDYSNAIRCSWIAPAVPDFLFAFPMDVINVSQLLGHSNTAELIGRTFLAFPFEPIGASLKSYYPGSTASVSVHRRQHHGGLSYLVKYAVLPTMARNLETNNAGDLRNHAEDWANKER